MPKLKVLSGDEVLKILAEFKFEIEAQRGSHAKLRRFLSDGTRQTLTVPMHDENR
jgi:predicted RNA binding protein YcfA (HicA-like mRNA interferase family)